MKQCNKIIEENMVHGEFKTSPYSHYKDGCRAFMRIIDFLERFVPANQHLIQDHQNKLQAKKKTRRYVPTREFIQITEIMAKMHELLQRIQIKPTQSNTTYTMAYYYSEISEVNRLHYDS